MFNILTDAIEHNFEVDLVYLDFARAFAVFREMIF